MKHFVIAALISVTFSSLFSQSSLQDSLILSLSFTGNTADSSGNQNDAQIFGATFTDDRFGNPASAISLDGIDDYLTVLNNQKLHSSLPITIAAWVYLGNNGNNMIIRSEWQENFYSGVWLALNGGRISGTYADGGPVGPGSRRTVRSDAAIPLNTWVHISTIITGPSSSEIYINGRKACVSYSGSGGNLLYNGNNGRIGTSDPFATPGALFFYEGKIDEINMYNRALQQSEIEQLAEVDPLPTAAQIDSVCTGDSLVLNSPMGGYSSVTWSPAGGLSCTTCPSPLASPSQQTTYQVTLTKSANCVDVATYQVDVVDCCTGAFSAFFEGISEPRCPEDSLGSFFVQGANGTPPYQYSIDSITYSSTGQFDNLPPGSYTVWVRDSFDCEFDTTITLAAPPANLNTQFSFTGETAFGANDGSAKVIPSGGNGGPWSYLWSNGATTDSIVGLAPGVYVVTVTDQLGCVYTDSVSVPGARVSLEDETDPNLFTIYPNPTSGQVIISSPKRQGIVLTCVDLLGREVGSWELNPGTSSSELSIDVPAGTYYLVGESDKKIQTVILSVR